MDIKNQYIEMIVVALIIGVSLGLWISPVKAANTVTVMKLRNGVVKEGSRPKPRRFKLSNRQYGEVQDALAQGRKVVLGQKPTFFRISADSFGAWRSTLQEKRLWLQGNGGGFLLAKLKKGTKFEGVIGRRRISSKADGIFAVPYDGRTLNLTAPSHVLEGYLRNIDYDRLLGTEAILVEYSGFTVMVRDTPTFTGTPGYRYFQVLPPRKKKDVHPARANQEDAQEKALSSGKATKALAANRKRARPSVGPKQGVQTRSSSAIGFRRAKQPRK